MGRANRVWGVFTVDSVDGEFYVIRGTRGRGSRKIVNISVRHGSFNGQVVVKNVSVVPEEDNNFFINCKQRHVAKEYRPYIDPILRAVGDIVAQR